MIIEILKIVWCLEEVCYDQEIIVKSYNVAVATGTPPKELEKPVDDDDVTLEVEQPKKPDLPDTGQVSNAFGLIGTFVVLGGVYFLSKKKEDE